MINSIQESRLADFKIIKGLVLNEELKPNRFILESLDELDSVKSSIKALTESNSAVYIITLDVNTISFYESLRASGIDISHVNIHSGSDILSKALIKQIRGIN